MAASRSSSPRAAQSSSRVPGGDGAGDPFRFLLVDVFTDRPFGGNQLAVFPDAEGIAEEHLQPIARELNFSETVFLLPSRGEELARLRIFTPEAEIPFAGHPVVGTVFALEREARLTENAEFQLHLDCGAIPLRLQRGESGALLQATMTQPRPVFMAEAPRAEMVAHALGLQTRDILITGLPCEVVSTGLPFHVVPVGSLETIRSIEVDPMRLRKLGELLGVSDLYVFTFETEDPSATVHCRMFAPSYGIPEDAATGSAAGCLGAYLVKNRAVQSRRLNRVVVEQGLEIGRPSRITVEIETMGERIAAVRVGGSAVVVGEGRLDLS
jgi:trans-2,3-dihydro-3-hydroxyanthranilate isomerase